ncbi:MAG: chorismate mutase [Dehalococcoidia bacterium]|jgi:chorismate mutase
MKCRGIRGATTVDTNTAKSIHAATGELLREMIKANDVAKDDIASIIFTVTDDLNAAFPAKAARDMGMSNTPLLCSREIDVPDSLQSCLRILILFNTSKKPDDIKHIYLKGAVVLRSDDSDCAAGEE